MMTAGFSIERAVFEICWNQAAAGDRGSALELAEMIQDGRGCRRDPELAVGILRDLAMTGEADAMVLLGKCYAYGDGVSVDLDAARSWFTNAAEAGSGMGAAYLADFLSRYGDGEDDAAECLGWALRVLEVGDADLRALVRGALPNAISRASEFAVERAGLFGRPTVN